MSYGVTPQLRAPLRKRQGGYGVSFATTRSQQLAEGEKPRHTPRLPSVAVPRYPFRDTREASDVLSGIKVIGGLARVYGWWMRKPHIGELPRSNGQTTAPLRVSAEGLSVAG